MKKKSFYLTTFILFVILSYSCNNKKDTIENKYYSYIDSMWIGQHPTVGPNYIGFRIYTNDPILGKSFNDKKLTKISIKGAFFNDSSFYFTKPKINMGKNNDTFYIFSHTSNFINLDQRSLDSIVQSVVGEIKIFVQNDTNKWVIQKCEKKY